MNLLNVSILSLVTAGACAGTPHAAAAEPPNVILLLVDDMGYGDVAALGNPVLKTPNFDTLHGQSARFTNFAVSPSCAPTRAALLTGSEEAIVVDIGGTTADLGVLQRGFPRQSAGMMQVGGVHTNFRMPDILSIGLGGGSIVENNGALSIGPQSVGYELTSKSLIFGGYTLTATDIAVARGNLDIGDRTKVSPGPAVSGRLQRPDP